MDNADLVIRHRKVVVATCKFTVFDSSQENSRNLSVKKIGNRKISYHVRWYSSKCNREIELNLRTKNAILWIDEVLINASTDTYGVHQFDFASIPISIDDHPDGVTYNFKSFKFKVSSTSTLVKSEKTFSIKSNKQQSTGFRAALGIKQLDRIYNSIKVEIINND